MENIRFSTLTRADLPRVKEIYDYYIAHSTATFHTREISLEELAGIIPVGHPKYKSLVLWVKNRIGGYCYLSQYKKREAYDRTAEVTIYLDPSMAGKGIGLLCLQQLEQVAVDAGIKVLLGIISGDNKVSIRLFEKAGYEQCAHFRKVGEKFGKVLDVLAYEKILDE